ncbi:hypothetical protein V502_06845 [Pseudogymnoascus sp. VKM F-4520 (FW-2644)]|nr:hypothetical protein V502_06845 [Pseudogymnoascus sp. VKM F-4520 (FW-2644)]
MRSHLMSGSAKKGSAKRPNFDMPALEPSDELFVRDGTIRTKLQQQLAPFGRDLHIDHGLYGGNQNLGRVENSRHRQTGYIASRDVPQSSIHSYETKLEPISTVESVEGDYDVQDDMEAIRRKRFRILREGDWLGLSIQRPLQLKYMESESRDEIGKRRKLNAGHEAKYSRVQDKIASPFAPNRHIPSGDIFPKPGQNQPQGSVRIFIDGRERYVRESSGSVTNRLHPEYVQSSSSSDVMLLDLERVGSRQRLPHQLSSDMVNGSGCIPEPVEQGRQGSEEKSISSFGDYPSSGPRIHQIKGPNRNMYAPSLQHQGSPIISMDRTKTNWPGASLVIYHPTPRSSTTSRLLRSNSSIFDGGVAATAGRKGTVTASVAQDEEMWRSWLVTESDDEQSPAWLVDGQSDELAPDGPDTSMGTTQSISPRLSSTDQSDRNGGTGHGMEPIPSIPKLLSSAAGSPYDDNLVKNNKTLSLGTVRASKPRRPTNDDIKLPTGAQKQQSKEANRDTAWEAFVLAESSENLVDPVVESQKKAAQENPDAAWKKFVLSSDSDDENSTFSRETGAESETSASHKRMKGPSSQMLLQVHPAETVIHSGTLLDQSSGAASARVVFKPSTHIALSRSNGSEASGSLSGTSIYPRGSERGARQASRYFPQATGKPSEMAANKKGKPEDPLARYMPQQSHSERDIAMVKDAQLPARNESFERELDDSLKQALLLGRRYAKREKEIYTKQGNEAHAKQEKERYAKQGKERHARRGKESYVKRKSEDSGDIYDIPISDDTEGVDNE